MAFVLKGAVRVAADPDRDGYTPGLMIELEAGTRLSDIAASEKAQLAPAHFTDDTGKEPADWRDPAAQARDDQQAAFLEQYIAEHTTAPGG